MYLKNLTVLGFKSFADKTTLSFQPGVTAIVGPNGCGKSNVSDAVRWVLGEQSAKALRGGEMCDVIFNGTDGRKPLGLAEVSLTIGGVDQEHLKAAGVEIAYNEVTITRRVFRDGGSEYFINKTPCRLKDIQQLFMGTGVGRTSYSIMAQGNITQILSSKPEDRRMIFEEAAGITKFKAQKKEALRKLEYTDQNLLRVSDLIREVKRQIGSLQRQAGKARRYKALMTELQHLDTQLARHQFDVLQAEITERQQSADKLKLEIEASTQSVLRIENEISQLRQRLSETEQQISQSQQRGLELKSASERHESRIHFNEERILELEAQHGKALAEIAEADERKRAAEEALTAITGQLGDSIAALEQHRQTLEQRRHALQAVEEDLRHSQETLREAQAEAFAAAQQLSRLRNEINALELQQQGNAVRLEKLSAEKVQLEAERQRLEVRLHEFAAAVEVERLNAQTSRGTLEHRQHRLQEIQQDLAATTQELDKHLRTQAETRSRLAVLEQLQAAHEGFSAGAVTALKQSDRVLGSLADRIRVPHEYVTAIEIALGQHLQLVLTGDPEAAQNILAELSNTHQGRASIAPMAFFDPASQTEIPDDFDTPILAEAPPAPRPLRAISVIEMESSVRPLLERLLGLTRIVPDLATATKAWREDNGAFHYVTLSGEMLSRQGVYTGGATNGSSQSASILGRKNQIAELQDALARIQQQVTEFSRRKGELLGEQTELQAGLQQTQSELRAQEVAIATHEGEFNALQTSHRSLHQKIDTVVYEVQSLAAQEQEGLQKRAALGQRAADLETLERATQIRVAELSAQLDTLRQQRDITVTALTEAKVAVASQEQLSASFRQQQQPLEQRIRELIELALHRRNEIGAFAARRTQWATEIDDSRRQIERLHEERTVVSNQTAALCSEKDAQESEIGSREEILRERRQRLSEIQHQRGTIEIELAQKNMATQNLRERIQQKYHLNLDDIRSECITITIADEGPPKVQTLTPEEMAAVGASTDWNAVGEQVVALQRRIEEMGPVNLVAIDEYEETEQRHQFLSTQYEDLTRAKSQLLEVINRINTQTKEMFVDTFNKIRENFRAMFTEIFGGGKADLLLVNEGDVLESGIDIVARPPGKQLQTISLLSGGEQTMTAVALLFSIYQVKPSPFCVLDELDAPLDESNINRFVRVLQRFLAHSQFIIITHNKRTIGMADVLYGVTMEEQGVSKIVSVKFHKADEEREESNLLQMPARPQHLDADEDVVMAK
jgi:chromosome segregation protein